MNNYLPTDYQNFIALSRYARWNDEEQRRETWLETVDRYFDYMDNHLKRPEIQDAILLGSGNAQRFSKTIQKDFFDLGQEKIFELDNSINSFVGCCSFGTGHSDSDIY